MKKDKLFGIDPVDAALYEVAHDFKDELTGKSGVAALAEHLGAKADTLNHKFNPTMESHHLNIKEFRQTLLITENLSPIHALLNEFNLVAVSKGEQGAFSDTALIECITGIDVERGEFMSLLTKALDDGEITEDEWGVLEREGLDVVRAWLELLRRVKSLVKTKQESSVVPLNLKKNHQ